MTNGQSSVGSDGEGTASPLTLDALRERVTARRRRARQNRPQSMNWVVVRTRRQRMQMIAVCAGALLLMAIGLYFGLARQESPSPVEGAAPTGTAAGIA